MKKVSIFLLIICILIGCKTIPPNKQIRNLDGFLGIAWEEKISNVVSILNENNYRITLIGDDYIYAEGMFMDEENIEFILHFFDDRFYTTDMYSGSRSRQFELYSKIIDIFTNKYGKPNYVKTTPGITNEWYFDNNCDILTYFYENYNMFRIRITNINIYKEKNKIY